MVISKLVRVASEERALLQECHELLGRLSALQVALALLLRGNILTLFLANYINVQIEEQSLRCHSMVQSSSLNLVKVN